MVGRSVFPAIQPVSGTAVSDFFSPLSDEEEKGGDSLQDLSPASPSSAGKKCEKWRNLPWPT